MKNDNLDLQQNIDLAIIKDDIFKRKFPENIFAICIKYKAEKVFLSIEHDGKIPNMNNERERSFANDYLANLEMELVDNYFSNIGVKNKPQYSNILEIMTNNNGTAEYFSQVK